jgi:hypothetical protein
LRELLVREQIPGRVRDDEFIFAFAVADRIGRFVLVFDKPDDFEFDLAPVGRFDGEDVTQLQRTVSRRVGLTVSIIGVYGAPPISVQVAFDIRIVFPERPGERVMSVPFIDVIIVVRLLWMQCTQQ